MTMAINYNPTELLICMASRLIEDNTTAFVGTGIPMLAVMVAQRRHAPGLIPIFEFGGTGAILETLPRQVGDRHTYHQAISASWMADIMETAQRGCIEYGFLGGAQIDPYGNLNSTVIGPHAKPKVRLPGSGGANDVGSLCWRTIAIMRHGRQRFVPKCDFVTTPGYLDGPGARERVGLPAGTGPYRVVSDLGIMDYEPGSLRMRLVATSPGITAKKVLDETGFELLLAPSIEQIQPPEKDELLILREIDKDKLYI